MGSRLWGPWTVIIVYTLAGGLIGADIALWPWNPSSLTLPVTAGLLIGVLAGCFIAWFVKQMEEMS